MRELYIEAGKEDCYKVISKHIEKGKVVQTKIYRADLRNWFCQDITNGERPVVMCKGFQFRHKCMRLDNKNKVTGGIPGCVHLNSVIQLLRAGGIGIVWDKKCNSFYTNWDYQDVEKVLRESVFRNNELTKIKKESEIETFK